MQFDQPFNKKTKLGEGENFYNESSLDEFINFYKNPPKKIISLADFDKFSHERYLILQAIENAAFKNTKFSEAYMSDLEKEINKVKRSFSHKLKDSSALSTKISSKDEDEIGHFLLRLCLCKTDELRKRFVNLEADYFKFKLLQYHSILNLEELLNVAAIKYEVISQGEKETLKKFLTAASFHLSEIKVMTLKYFKVHWTLVAELVRKRYVYLRKGNAYVPSSEIANLLVPKFRAHLSQALISMSKMMHSIEEEERLVPMINNFYERYSMNEDPTSSLPVQSISSNQVASLKKSFPLCMRILHEALESDHKLRHWGRRQYGLFLKAIGLSLPEALKFWNSHFTKLIDSEKFEKQYSYSIRHNYGQEGKRVSYSDYSCLKIIMSNPPAAGDYHGCPFKHSDKEFLVKRLRASYPGLSMAQISEIAEVAKGGHYQVACAKHWSHLHPSSKEQVCINYPSDFYKKCSE